MSNNERLTVVFFREFKDDERKFVTTVKCGAF